jgi:hypothetical protein
VTISSRRAAGSTGKRQKGQLDIHLIRERDDWFASVAPKTFPRDHAGVASPLHKASVVSAAHCRLPDPPCRLSPVVRVGRAPKISTPENDRLGTGARCVPEPRGAVQAVCVQCSFLPGGVGLGGSSGSVTVLGNGKRRLDSQDGETIPKGRSSDVVSRCALEAESEMRAQARSRVWRVKYRVLWWPGGAFSVQVRATAGGPTEVNREGQD